MEQQDTQASIQKILRESPVPLRALDISRKLAEVGITASAQDVNKILYKGPFDKAPGTGTPTWKARVVPITPRFEGSISFEVDGLGVFSLRPELSDTNIESLLSFLATLVPADSAKKIHHDSSAGGKKVAGLAAKAGFAALEAV